MSSHSPRRPQERCSAQPPALRTYRFVVIALALLVSTGSALQAGPPAPSSLGLGHAPQEEDQARANAPPEELFEKTIRSAYRALEDYTANAGTKVEFQLSNLVTHIDSSLGDLRLIEVATMPEGRVIDVGRKGRSLSLPDGEREINVAYQAKWRTMETDWRSNPQTVAGVDLPVTEAMKLKAQEDPIFGHLEAITTYDVTATLDGMTREYRASFFWFAENGWQSFDLLAVDHITQGVEAALRETVPVEGMTVPPSERPPERKEKSSPSPQVDPDSR